MAIDVFCKLILMSSLSVDKTDEDELRRGEEE
jgi:hypothetical protein